MDAEPLLQITGVSLVANGRSILQDIDLAIAPGEVHALVGANGSGKTTLARLVMGAADLRPTAGSLRLGDEDLLPLPIHERARRGMAIAWQEPVTIEGLTVADYLGCGAVKVAPEDCLARVALDPREYLARSLDRTLSGGERRRIELAALLSLAPRLAIVDEPTAGIDLASLPLIEATVLALRASGSAVLLITHEEAMARQADSASQLCGGRIVCQGRPERVVERYKRRQCTRCDGAGCRE
ncbi:MAG: ATP-binding cassette domain-containing protein [Comamonadaceae bacterium]|nr:ATP-binding cassette domain-containing protein [Comamonadaceae bacterium]